MFKKKRRKGAVLDLQLMNDKQIHGKLKRHVGFDHKYRTGKRTYLFPVGDYTVLTQATALGIEICGIPAYVYNSPVCTTVTSTLPDLSKLYPFQQEGVLKAIEWGRCLIADEMGLGKTVQALTLIKYYGGRALVICPSYLTLNWMSEGQKWGVELIRIKNSKVPIPAGNLVVSYDIAAKRVKELGAFTTVVCDESHYLKSHKTKRTKRIKPLVLRTPHVFLLTGTPAANRPIELYSQISMIQPKCWSTYTNFAERYCGAKQSPLGFVDVSGATHKEELSFRLKTTSMIRRLKRDVLDLPPKVRSRVDLETTGSAAMRKGMRRWKEINLMEPVPENLVLERQRIVSELFRETCRVKENAVRHYLRDLPENVIIFAYHKRMLDVVCDTLNCIRIDGDVPMERRQTCLDLFVNGDVPYAALSISAAGTGLTITSCSTVVFAELYYVPGVLLQAEDRTHRIGQLKSVDVRYLCASNTLDDHIWKMVQRKLKITDSCLDGRTDREF